MTRDGEPVATPQPAAGTQTGAPAEEKRTERPHPLTPVIRGWVVVLALAVGLGRELLKSLTENQSLPPLQFLFGGLGAVVVVAMLIGLVSWLTTRFVIDTEELRVESGVLVRRSQRIAFDKVAGIDVLQPLAARIFGLAELEIDIGSHERVKLRYLGRRRAYALRDYLLSRAHGHRAEVAESAPDSGLELSDLQADDEVLVRLPTSRIVQAALSSNEFLGLAVTILVVVGVAAGISVLLDPALASELSIQALAGSGVAVIALVISGLSGVVGFVTRRITGQFNFTLSRRPAGLRVSRGLTSLTSQSVPPRRVQAVRLSQSMLWRRLGWYEIQVDVLGQRLHNEEDTRAGTSSVLMPVADAAQVQLVLDQLWPGVRHEEIALRRVPARARWLHPVTGPFLALGHDRNLVVARHGWWERRWDLVPHARVQSLSVKQGPVSRSLGLADLELHTAGSRITVRARGLDAAGAMPQAEELTLLAQAHGRDLTLGPQPAAAPGVTGRTGRPQEEADALRADQAEETICSTG